MLTEFLNYLQQNHPFMFSLYSGRIYLSGNEELVFGRLDDEYPEGQYDEEMEKILEEFKTKSLIY